MPDETTSGGMVAALHVTNGDAATPRLRAAGVEGPVLPWRDVLCDGPLPPTDDRDAFRDARARFLEEAEWAAYEAVRVGLAERDGQLESALAGAGEVVVWLEHDLYDQLQLLEILAVAAAHPARCARLTLAQADDYLGHMAPDAVRALWPRRAELTADDLAVARRAWDAVRAADPRAVERVAADPALRRFPHLAPALRRLLEELPDERTGLARSERELLEAIAAGRAQLGDTYVAAHHERESPIWMGDGSFALAVARLASAPHALLTGEDGALARPAPGDRGFWRRRAVLTDTGRRVLAGEADHVALNGVTRWLGGVRLDGDSPWRWNGERVVERLTRG